MHLSHRFGKAVEVSCGPGIRLGEGEVGALRVPDLSISLRYLLFCPSGGERLRVITKETLNVKHSLTVLCPGAASGQLDGGLAWRRHAEREQLYGDEGCTKIFHRAYCVVSVKFPRFTCVRRVRIGT